jgi:hypothetical protein
MQVHYSNHKDISNNDISKAIYDLNNQLKSFKNSINLSKKGKN